MNKKGMFELAELGGFVLILIATIVFGIIFIQLSPSAKIEILDVEYNHMAKYLLLDFLNHEENGRNMADSIVSAIKENNFHYINKKFSELLDSGSSYFLTISKNGGVIHYSTNIKSEEAIPVSLIEPEYEYKYDIYGVKLNNFYEDNINVKMYLLKSIAEAENE